MTPTEFATTVDSRIATVLAIVRGRLVTIFSEGRGRLAALRATPPDTDPTDAPRSPAASDPDATDPDATDPDTSTNEEPDEPASFPVLAEETERDIHDVLLERGLTREEYVCEILAEHDGRLRQQRIKEYTGWSAASVSRLLGRMEDEGTITRFRIGNEKVVCVPDADPRTDVFEIDIPASP